MNKLNTLEPLSYGIIGIKINEFEDSVGFKLPLTLSTLLEKYNVFRPHRNFYKASKIEFTINCFLGFSTDKYRDLLSVYRIYEDRMPQEIFPIANVDGGDLLCMHKETSAIYYWFHEEDDWGIEGVSKWPTLINTNLVKFIEELGFPDSPTQEEIEQAKKYSRVTITPKSVEIRNLQRVQKGLPPLTLEEWDKLLNGK